MAARTLGADPVGGDKVLSSTRLFTVVQPPSPASNPSVNRPFPPPVATVIGSDATDPALVLGPSEADTTYVWTLPPASPVSAQPTEPVEALETVPTAVAPPSRNTR